ncbi:hypothetical protein HOY82DRAFT_615821 [Tuber indicum]|nr:hypothetical protein HOY82DRAFT_615821 [Tuber indicum]
MHSGGLDRTLGCPQEPQKIGIRRHEQERGGGYLRALDGAGRKNMSKSVAFKDPHGDGVRAIVKNKTTIFLKARKKKAEEAKKASKENERRLQEKAMAGKRTGGMF